MCFYSSNIKNKSKNCIKYDGITRTGKFLKKTYDINTILKSKLLDIFCQFQVKLLC